MNFKMKTPSDVLKQLSSIVDKNDLRSISKPAMLIEDQNNEELR